MSKLEDWVGEWEDGGGGGKGRRGSFGLSGSATGSMQSMVLEFLPDLLMLGRSLLVAWK